MLVVASTRLSSIGFTTLTHYLNLGIISNRDTPDTYQRRAEAVRVQNSLTRCHPVEECPKLVTLKQLVMKYVP